MTRQREVILQQVRESSDHPTADTIYKRVRQILPNVSLGTVYRNLEVLANNGLIRELRLCYQKRRFDGGMHPHYHVRCIKCGKVCDVSPQAIPDLNGLAQRGSEFEILDHTLEFEGLCPQCRGRKADVDETGKQDAYTNGPKIDAGEPGPDETNGRGNLPGS